MSDKDNHMAMYSSSDIEKYLSGELSDPEMHALERAALDDPFLADALEGMAVHRSLPDQPPFAEDVAGLEKRLEGRVSAGKKFGDENASGDKGGDKVSSGTKGRGRLLPLGIRYAAAVVLLLGLGTTAYFALFSKKMNADHLSQTPVKVESADRAAEVAKAGIKDQTVAGDQGSTQDQAEGRPQAKTQPQTEGRLRTEANPPTASKDQGGAQATAGIQPEGGRSQDQEVAQSQRVTRAPTAKRDASDMDSTTVNRYSTAPIASNTRNKNTFSNLAKQPGAPAYSNNSSTLNSYYIAPPATRSFLKDSPYFYRDSLAYNKNADQLVFRGKVINAQNIPLAGATLMLKGRRSFITTTDKDGNFTLKLPKKDSTSRVLVNYIGYEQGYATLDMDDKRGNIILLKPQSQSLNEVVVVGYGAKRKEFTQSNINSVPKPLSQTAVPKEGWPAYTDYLEINKRSPELDSTIRGYESISFIVNKKGELSSFKVEQSLSPAHDSLTIRLIRQGPSWKLLAGKKERARVVVTW